MIIRPDYLKTLNSFRDAPVVKILTGIRRCGKSTILKLFKEELLKSGVSEDNVIERNYASLTLLDDITAKSMSEDLTQAMCGKGKCYLLLDEIQEIDGWEKAINRLLEEKDADIYITGSNSKLTAGEISTYLTGRYVTIPVYTLSFKEYLDFKKGDGLSSAELLEEYIRYGGFPLLALGNYDEHSAYQLVEGIYSTVITMDISKRHGIKKQDLFERVVTFIMENTGKTFSANSITNFLKGEKRSLDVETVYNYLKWLEQAFIIYPCKRYDIQGKEVLKTQEKFYLADVSLRYCLLGYNRKMQSSAIENIVYLELKRRGYEVYIGKLKKKEIDLIGERRGERIYVQVCVQLSENSDREISNLMEINDHYPKYVVTMDKSAVGNENGIKIVHLADFLTDNF